MISAVIEFIENGILAAILATLGYMLTGGWENILRSIGFFFDKQLVKLIGTVYSYFTTLIEGTMFSEKVINELMRNIYVFIGIIVFFRLMMVVIKYLVNPDLIGDAKVGVNSLVQRVIIGACGILFIPTIFDTMMALQSAILNDNLVQKLIVPHDMIEELEKKVDKGGHYIGTYVLSGFLSPNSNASDKDIKQYKLGVQKGDLSIISINDGAGLSQNFKYDYFVLISTLALGYVLYLMLKYCIDIAGSYFKFLFYQILAPVAMIEYMINGSQDGVYKSWLTGVLSTYFMLFVRILSIWFVIFVMSLMGDNPGSAEYAGSLLKNDDYFLRAIIIIALLGFMMDLPKFIGKIFNLDLEQEGSASGILKQVGGMVKGAAIGALAVGGTAAAGGYSLAKNGIKTMESALPRTNLGKKMGQFGNTLGQKFNNTNLGKITGQASNKMKKAADKFNATPVGQDLKMIGEEARKNEFGSHVTKAGAGILGAVLGANQFTGAAYKGYSGQAEEQKGIDKKRAQEAQEQARHEEIVGNQQRQIRNQTEAAYRDIIERVAETEPPGTPKDVIQAKAMLQLFGNPTQMTAEVNGRLAAISNAGGNIEAQDVVQNVQQVLSQKLDVSPNEVSQVVNQVLANGGSLATPAEVEQVVSRVVNQVQGSRASAGEQTINQVVNQVYGTRVNNSVDNATQVVSQKLDQQIDIQRNISDNVSQSVDIQEQIQYDVHAQTNIQRNQVSMVDDIRENTERSANSLDSIDRKTGGGNNP